jgi:LysM repeat protein
MNTPNPLVPQGSLERQSKGRSTVRIAIFTIVSIHAVFFAGLLMQGCRPDANKTAAKPEATNTVDSLPPLGTTPTPPPPTATQEVAQSAPPPVSTLPPPANTYIPGGTEPPPAAPLPPTEATVETKPYKVVKGDTLAKIAKAHNVSLRALTKANLNVDPAKLKVGQTIQIPAASSSSAGIGFTEPAKDGTAGGNVHTVKAGETLTKIAKQYGTTAKAVRAANNLKTDRLLVGQKLKVPAAHETNTSAETGKTTSMSKLSSTNPGDATLPSNSNTTTIR